MRSVPSTAANAWHRLRAAAVARTLHWSRRTYSFAPARWLVLQSGANPSTDYYVRPRAAASKLPLSIRDIDKQAPADEDFAAGTRIVIVRYLNRPWADAVRLHADELAEVVYFMDDDLLDPSAWHGLPAPYHGKLARHFATVAHDIATLASRVWVSTPSLAVRYAALEPEVTPPLPLVDDAPRGDIASLADIGFVRLFYHGTQAHEAEIRWLHPIVAACLEACPQLHFELIGNHAVNQLYRDLPRTRVLHPMAWTNYLAHCRTMRGHIGLAPLLESRFNAGRSPTRMMDVARCGATGVYTRAAPYDTAVCDGVDGVLLDNDARLWIDLIIGLTRDRAALLRLREGAAKRCLQLDPAPFASA